MTSRIDMKVDNAKSVLNMFEDIDTLFAYHDMLCGKFISRGVSRTVFECGYDESCVVKIDKSSNDNIIEWELWNMLKYMPEKISNWFAPCVRISNNGRILIQKKTKPLSDKQWESLKEVPSFLTDIKRSNFGMYKGNLCMHDYAGVLVRLKFDSRLIKISKEDRARI